MIEAVTAVSMMIQRQDNFSWLNNDGSWNASINDTNVEEQTWSLFGISTSKPQSQRSTRFL